MEEETENSLNVSFSENLINSVVSGDREKSRALLINANNELVGGRGGHFKNTDEGGDLDRELEEIDVVLRDDFKSECQRTIYLGDGMHRITIYIDKDDPDYNEVFLGHSMTPRDDVAAKWEAMNRV